VAFYVYMLLCSDGSVYTGHTDNLEARLDPREQALYDRELALLALRRATGEQIN